MKFFSLLLLALLGLATAFVPKAPLMQKTAVAPRGACHVKMGLIGLVGRSVSRPTKSISTFKCIRSNAYVQMHSWHGGRPCV